jgi:hypothetical protein
VQVSVTVITMKPTSHRKMIGGGAQKRCDG